MAQLDEKYIRRMEDVLKLCEKPVSEEEPVVLHWDINAPRPVRSGHIVRRDYEYKRCGTANVFCGVEPNAGRHFPKPKATRSATEFADYLVEIVARYPEARTIHLVLGNLNTHRRKSMVKRHGEKLGSLLWSRFTIHYTPRHGSWLNQAEIEVSLVSRQCLGQRRILDLTTLRGEVRAWDRRSNRDRTTIDWKFTRKQARRKLHYSTKQARYQTASAVDGQYARDPV